jgi:hypothetical protein
LLATFLGVPTRVRGRGAKTALRHALAIAGGTPSRRQAGNRKGAGRRPTGLRRQAGIMREGSSPKGRDAVRPGELSLQKRNNRQASRAQPERERGTRPKICCKKRKPRRGITGALRSVRSTWGELIAPPKKHHRSLQVEMCDPDGARVENRPASRKAFERRRSLVPERVNKISLPR